MRRNAPLGRLPLDEGANRVPQHRLFVRNGKGHGWDLLGISGRIVPRRNRPGSGRRIAATLAAMDRSSRQWHYADDQILVDKIVTAPLENNVFLLVCAATRD